ncbi:hypothetical protein SteCoe_31523 [Stentor coeruleus]|uniref:C2 domain-containing protein n=1 Tax=Stentor coeruleus TaxID=5963 RepID=A0A1R2B138_9CILI|nr:hypothetical protein SteCoe_31523 [Stentor coeruleus]
MDENSLKTEILICIEVKGNCKWKFEIDHFGSSKRLFEILEINSEKNIVQIPFIIGGQGKIIVTAYIVVETSIICEAFSPMKRINEIKSSVREISLIELIKNGVFKENFTINKYYNSEATITLGEEIPNEKFVMFFQGINLDKKDFFGSSDPYLIISKEKINSPENFTKWEEICRTNIIKNNINPIWDSIEFRSQEVYDYRQEIKIKIDCYDWNKKKPHEFIGSCETKLRELLIPGTKLMLYDQKDIKKSSSGYINKCSGSIQINQIKIDKIYTYLDYIRAGLNICVVLGIDFKISNGEFTNYLSLHYLSNINKNPYEKALENIVSVLEKLKKTDKYYVYGFGGIPESQDTPGVFPLNFNQDNPVINKIEGVIGKYREAVKKVIPYNQEFISQMIDGTNASTGNYSYAELYTVLTIFTDGKNNVDIIKESIERTSRSPLSIIIVGVEEIVNNTFEILNEEIQGERHNAIYIPKREIEDLKKLQEKILGKIIKQIEDFMRRVEYVPNIPTLMESYRRLRKIKKFF